MLARDIQDPSPDTVFLGDLVVCENPWNRNRLLVRRVRRIISPEGEGQNPLVWVSSETMNGGVDSAVFGPISMDLIVGRAVYYFTNERVGVREIPHL